MARGKSSGGSNSHMTDSPGPRDGMKSMDYNPQDMGNYKSTPTGKGAVAGVRDTSGGGTQELKRSAPNVGVYQSGNNNRGGAATRNYDKSLDKYDTYEAEGLKALRESQDRRSGRGSEND